MQLHRSRPEPRLSTFERCWLGGATGRVRSPWRSGQATRATYSRSAPPDQSARSARRARPLKRTALLAKPMNGINAPQWHVRFELRNVVANYPFEKSRRFGGIQPNSGPGDHSHLSYGAGDTQLEAGFYRGSPASVLHGRCPSCGVAEKIRIGRDLFRSEDDPAAAKPATPLRSLRWTFRAKRACVVITDAEPDRLAPLTPPAPMGLRGVWVVAARYCASPPARCCADAVERSFACPSANLRAPSRRGLHPRSVRRRPAAISPRGERIRSRRGCWHCCADRAAPPSPPSRAPPAGSRTR